MSPRRPVKLAKKVRRAPPSQLRRGHRCALVEEGCWKTDHTSAPPRLYASRYARVIAVVPQRVVRGSAESVDTSGRLLRGRSPNAPANRRHGASGHAHRGSASTRQPSARQMGARLQTLLSKTARAQKTLADAVLATSATSALTTGAAARQSDEQPAAVNGPRRHPSFRPRSRKRLRMFLFHFVVGHHTRG